MKRLWKNSRIVEGLRQSGKKVSIKHARIYKEVWVDASSTCKVLEEQISPKGGSTVVEIVYPDGRKSTGIANCRANEPFDKKLGVAIALKRALNASKDAKRCEQICNNMVFIVTSNEFQEGE